MFLVIACLATLIPPGDYALEAPGLPASPDGGQRYGVMGVPADARSGPALRDLGVGWARFTIRLGEKNMDLRTIARQGVRLWVTLSHRDRTNIEERGTIGFAKSVRGGFAPADYAKYRRLIVSTLKPLADEFAKQGKNPGEWMIVQCENEVLPRDLNPPDQKQRFWHGTMDEYLATLLATYDAVKTVDPSIPVAMMGFSSEMLGEFISAKGRKQITAWGERLLSEGRYDWVDVHLYNRIDEMSAKVAWVKSRVAKPVAATEVGGPDPRAGEDYTEALHARQVSTRMKIALNAGASMAFWVLLRDTPGADERFRPMALIDLKWRRKPAFEAYRRVIAGE